MLNRCCHSADSLQPCGTKHVANQLWPLPQIQHCSCEAGVVTSTDPVEACKDIDVAVMVGGFPRKGGMERKDVMAKNVAIYKSQADALQKGAKPDVKVPRSCKTTLYPDSDAVQKNFTPSVV